MFSKPSLSLIIVLPAVVNVFVPPIDYVVNAHWSVCVGQLTFPGPGSKWDQTAGRPDITASGHICIKFKCGQMIKAMWMNYGRESEP